MSESPLHVKRANRTYGRRQATSDINTSPDTANTSLDTLEDGDVSLSMSSTCDPPPSSDDMDAFNASTAYGDVSDGEHHKSPQRPSGFRFRWQQELETMKRDDWEPDSSMSVDKPRTGDATAHTSPIDGKHDAASNLSLATSPSTPSPRTPEASRNPLSSDAGSDREDLPSSPRHSINTPKSGAGSSPTPPTSIEVAPMKGKGKARNTTPLQFEDDARHPNASKPSKLRKTTRERGDKSVVTTKRVKAPTKKEQAETQKATARLVSHQPVSVPRTQKNEYTLSQLGSKLRVDFAPPLVNDDPPTSDPIQGVSSPARPPDAHFSRRASTSKTTPQKPTFKPTGLLGSASDSDSDGSVEFLDGSKLAEQAEQEQAAAAKKYALLEAKRRAMEQAAARGDEDDDDDDIVIQDDPKSVAQAEAQARRGEAARGTLPQRGRMKQLERAGPGVHRESTPPPLNDPKDAMELLQRHARQAFAPSTSKSSAALAPLSPKRLSSYLLRMSDSQNAEKRRQDEADWVRRGGRLKQQHEASHNAASIDPQVALEEIAQRHKARARMQHEVELEDDSGSDREWRPDAEEDAEGEEAANENVPGNMDAASEADDEEDENQPPVHPIRRSGVVAKSRQVVDSDDEEGSFRESGPLPVHLVPIELADSQPGHRGSISSTGEHTDENRTEDGTDKENDVRLSFDRGDNKENTRIAVQSPLRVRRGFGSLFAEEIAASPSGTASRGTPDGVRSPLKAISRDDDDPFGPELPATLGLQASPMDLGAGFGFQTPASKKGKERARSNSPALPGGTLDLGGPLGGGGGFSQLFDQEGSRSFDQLKAAQDDIDLSQDEGPQAALEISGTFLRKADEIFQKEQEQLAVLEQEDQDESPETFINESGFLTQTRPAQVTPLHLTTPSQWIRPRFSSPLSSARRTPLGDLHAQDEPETATRPRRLHKRGDSRSPDTRPLPPLFHSEMKNAFDVLGKPPKKKRLGPSEFVAGEAEESDSDGREGFGRAHGDDDEDENDDGDDQDVVVEGLVDDQQMDDKTLALELVQEKVREQEEEDDAKNEQIQRAVIQGKYRHGRRRGREVGLSDSDSEDESGQVRPHKRQKKENHTIGALMKNPATAAFGKAYDVQVETDFSYLDEEQTELAGMPEDEPMQEDEDEDEQEDADEEEERGVVSAHDLQAQLRQVGKQNTMSGIPETKFDANDTSWMDGDSDDEDAFRVRETSGETNGRRRPDRPSQQVPQRNGSSAAQVDPRLQQWAKSESSSRMGGVVGRNTGGSAAVTGHGKAKAQSQGSSGGRGGGSFKAPRAAASGAGTSKPKLSKAPSVLSAVSSRRDKFTN